jgi:hypothetical protein
MNPLERFRVLRAEAQAAISKPDSIGCADIKPAGFAIIRLVAAHPEMRAEFVTLFGRTLHDGPWELLAFCMHSLRWPEVREIIQREREQQVARIGARTSPVFDHVLAAFDDDWEDIDMFSHSPSLSIGGA